MVFIFGLQTLISKKHVATKKHSLIFYSGSVVSSSRLWTTFDGVYRIRRRQGKNKKKRRRERRGDDGKERRGEDQKREEDNAANSRCLLACPFLLFFSHSRSLLFVAISSKEIIPTLTFTYSVPSLFFRASRRVANTSSLIRMRQARINLNKWRRAARAAAV